MPDLLTEVAAEQQAQAARTAPVVGVAGIAARAHAGVAGGSDDADRRAAEQASPVVLRRSGQPWLGAVSVPTGANDNLPSVFKEPVRLRFNDLRSGGKVGLHTVAERITAVTGVPVRVQPDVHAALTDATRGTVHGGSRPVGHAAGGLRPPVNDPDWPGASSGPAPLPRAGRLSSGEGAPLAVAMRWHGSLESFLDHVTDLHHLSWDYRDGVVVIERLRTEFFELATFDSDTQYAMGLAASEQGHMGSSTGGGGGISTNNASADVTEKGRSATVATLLTAIQHLIGGVPGSAVVRSEGSGRVAVTTSKEAMGRVRAFIRAENEAMLRQAQIQFDIYAIRRDASDERGIDWSVVLESVSDALRMAVSSPSTLAPPAAGTVNFTVMSPRGSNGLRVLPDSRAVLQLLSQFGASTQHRPVSLLTLNRQWARKASLGSKAYVSETVPGAGSTLGSGAPGLKTATVTTGDRYLALPHILDNNTVLLKFGVGLSSLVQIANFTSGTGTSQQTVQTPEISNLVDQSTVALKAGQLLVITGLSRWVASEDHRRLTENAPLGAGGSRRLLRQREDFVIFVRPTIL